MNVVTLIKNIVFSGLLEFEFCYNNQILGGQNPPKAVRMGPAAAVGTLGRALHHSRGIEEMAANNATSWNPSIGCPVRVSAIFTGGVLGFCSGQFRIPRKSPLDTAPRMGFNKESPR